MDDADAVSPPASRRHLDAGADHVLIHVLGDEYADPLPVLRELAPPLLELTLA